MNLHLMQKSCQEALHFYILWIMRIHDSGMTNGIIMQMRSNTGFKKVLPQHKNKKSIQRMKRYTQIKLPSSRGTIAFVVRALPMPRPVMDGPAG